MAEILSFSTAEPDREPVRIDGATYELAIMDDLGLDVKVRLNKFMPVWWRVITSLNPQSEEDFDPADIEKLQAGLDALVPHLILGCPRETVVKLSDTDKQRLMEHFLHNSGRMPSEILRALDAAWTSASWSQRSSGTTEEAQETGLVSPVGG